jgi:hypothetical protein
MLRLAFEKPKHVRNANPNSQPCKSYINMKSQRLCRDSAPKGRASKLRTLYRLHLQCGCDTTRLYPDSLHHYVTKPGELHMYVSPHIDLFSPIGSLGIHVILLLNQEGAEQTSLPADCVEHRRPDVAKLLLVRQALVFFVARTTSTCSSKYMRFRRPMS